MSHSLVDWIALCDREPERVAAFAKKESWRRKFNPRAALVGDIDKVERSALDCLPVDSAIPRRAELEKERLFNDYREGAHG